MKRRRFLQISAAATAIGTAGSGAAFETIWDGYALGAMTKITLRGQREMTEPALSAARARLFEIERAFSLYDPASDLVALNRTGQLGPMSSDWQYLLKAIDQVHAATDGLFDPSVQGLWTPERGAVDWRTVRHDATGIRLAPGQKLTFNGIAQGFASDAVSRVLEEHGFGTTLVQIGELRGRGGPWRIGIEDPSHGHLGTRTLSEGALATSAPSALLLPGGSAHIVDPLSPRRAPLWSSVTVEAADATTADGASTALCFADEATARSVLGRLEALRRVTLVNAEGDLMTLA